MHLLCWSLSIGLPALLKVDSDTCFQNFSIFSRLIGPHFYSYKDNTYVHHIWIYYIYCISTKGARAECPKEWWMTVTTSQWGFQQPWLPLCISRTHYHGQWSVGARLQKDLVMVESIWPWPSNLIRVTHCLRAGKQTITEILLHM